MKADEVDETLRKAALKAVQELDPSQTASFDAAQCSYYKDGKTLTALRNKNVSVILMDDKVDVIRLSYSYDKVPPTVKKGAEKLLQLLNASKSFKITEGNLTFAKNKSSWGFRALSKDDKNIQIGIDGKTGAITSYFVSSASVGSLLGINDNKYSKFKNEKVLASAKPQVKKVFGIDLTGYSVTRGKGETANLFTFTKNENSSVRGFINEKGEFYQFNIEE